MDYPYYGSAAQQEDAESWADRLRAKERLHSGVRFAFGAVSAVLLGGVAGLPFLKKAIQPSR